MCWPSDRDRGGAAGDLKTLLETVSETRVNISQVLSGAWDYVREDIKVVVHAAHATDQKVKVIFENCYLNEDQKIRLCEICTEVKDEWVKTATGYGTGGATDEDLKLMRAHSGEAVQVKAAGGVRTLDRLLEVRALGVTRSPDDGGS